MIVFSRRKTSFSICLLRVNIINLIDCSNRLENEWINDQSEKLFARFISLLGDLTYAGFNEIKLSTRPETIVDIPNFIMPQPKKTGRYIKISLKISSTFSRFYCS
jgi:hypothetical protein